MGNVKRIYVEKKESFAVKARELEEELKSYLGITGLKKVRIFIRYDVENLTDPSCRLQSELRRHFWGLLHLAASPPSVCVIVARV